MDNVAVYLRAKPFPIVMHVRGLSPADLLLQGQATQRVSGTALKTDGRQLEHAIQVSIPFDEIERIALSAPQKPEHAW